jgi:hypothetical protein
MMSLPIFEESDTTNAQMFFAQGGRLRIYVSVCYKVMHESPFLPESPKAPNEKGQPDVK